MGVWKKEVTNILCVVKWVFFNDLIIFILFQCNCPWYASRIKIAVARLIYSPFGHWKSDWWKCNWHSSGRWPRGMCMWLLKYAWQFHKCHSHIGVAVLFLVDPECGYQILYSQASQSSPRAFSSRSTTHFPGSPTTNDVFTETIWR